MILMKFLIIGFCWIWLTIAQLEEGWGGYLLITSILLGMIGYLGWTLLIFLCNLPLLTKLLVRLSTKFNKIIDS